MNVTDNIKALRKEKGLTQTEVAKRYGTSPEFYHRLEKKDKTLTIEQLEKIAKALGVTIIEVLGYTEKSHEVNDLEKRLEDLRKDNNELSAQNETLTNHNQTLFDQLKFFQDILKGLTSNPEGIMKIVQTMTGGNLDLMDDLSEEANRLFPDVAEKMKDFPVPPTDNT